MPKSIIRTKGFLLTGKAFCLKRNALAYSAEFAYNNSRKSALIAALPANVDFRLEEVKKLLERSIIVATKNNKASL